MTAPSQLHADLDEYVSFLLEKGDAGDLVVHIVPGAKPDEVRWEFQTRTKARPWRRE